MTRERKRNGSERERTPQEERRKESIARRIKTICFVQGVESEGQKKVMTSGGGP